MGFVVPDPARWDPLYRRAILFARAVKGAFAESSARAQLGPLLSPPPEMQYTSEWPPKLIQQVAEMVETAGGFDEAHLAYGAWLAVSRGWLDRSALMPCARTPDECQRFLAFATITIRCLRRTEDERASKPPPAELVMFQLADHWGSLIDEHTSPEIARHLAAAIADEQLTDRHAEAIVDQHRRKELAPWLARELASVAVETVRRAGLQGSADTGGSDEATASSR